MHDKQIFASQSRYCSSRYPQELSPSSPLLSTPLLVSLPLLPSHFFTSPHIQIHLCSPHPLWLHLFSPLFTSFFLLSSIGDILSWRLHLMMGTYTSSTPQSIGTYTDHYSLIDNLFESLVVVVSNVLLFLLLLFVFLFAFFFTVMKIF